MPREYKHIQEYEKEIIELWNQGKTLREIGEKLGFTYKQVQEFKTRYNRKQQKLAAGITIHRKGRPPNDYTVTEQDKVNNLEHMGTSDCGITPLKSVKF